MFLTNDCSCIRKYRFDKNITLPEHPTCENLISVSASKACCVQRVLGTGGITKPTGPRRGATMQSPHFVDTRDFIWIAPAIWQTTNYNWHACRPHQLYTCTSKCMCSATSLNANLVTDMPTNPANLVTDMPANPTVVHLHAKMLAFCNITQWKPCNIHVYKPYSCSPARKNVCFLNQYSMQTL